MTSIKWKRLTAFLIILIQCMCVVGEYKQEEISVDGWKPIIGNNRHNAKNYQYESYSTIHPTIMTVTRTSPKPIFRTSSNSYVFKEKAPYPKWYQSDPFIGLPSNQKYGPYVPINAVIHTRPGEIGHVKHLSTIQPFVQDSNGISYSPSPIKTKKPTLQLHNHSVKPMRLVTTTSNYNNDIFTASASTGAYSIYKQRPSNLRIRETADLDFPGKSNYVVSQPSAHIEFSRYFPSSTSKNLLQHNNYISVSPPIYKPNPSHRDISYQISKNNQEFAKKLNNSLPSFNTKNQYKSEPGNFLEIAPPLYFSQQKPEKHVEHQIQKHFQDQRPTLPVSYYSNPVEYNFKKATEALKPSYEVSESSNEAEFFTQHPIRVKEAVSTAQPHHRLNNEIPIFLPTPYKPINIKIAPTSATQNEVSTIFSHLSKKNQAEFIETPYNPKEASTHYPVEGQIQTNETPEVSFEQTLPESTRKHNHHRRKKIDRTQKTTTEGNSIDFNAQFDTAAVVTDTPATVRPVLRYRTRGNHQSRRKNPKVNDNTLRTKTPTVKPSVLPLKESPEVYSEFEFEIMKESENKSIGTSQEQTTEIIEPSIVVTTTEAIPVTKLQIPEKELTTVTEIELVKTSTLPTTITYRSKLLNSNRPRFSVKEYKQKLNMQISTTTSSPEKATEASKLKYPPRRRIVTKKLYRGRGESSSSESSSALQVTTLPTPLIITEKNIKSMNTRLRPFGKYKTTTTSTPSPRMSFKPNFFKRVRPTMLNLKSRIFNRRKENNETTTEQPPIIPNEEQEEADSKMDESEVETTTEVSSTTLKSIQYNEDLEKFDTTIDPYFYSQRVSDLTSSATNEYNKPGLFKSVSPSSRRIPNYFTIATEDPILPLEAFFSNIKDNSRQQS